MGKELTMGTELILLSYVRDYLTPQDDPEAWKAILDVMVVGVDDRSA